MTMLTALLPQRQVCFDPRILGIRDSNDAVGNAEHDSPTPVSGKISALRELMREIREGGHRVLVFSQFVSMLHLLRSELDDLEIPWTYLDGSSNDRDAQVERFQTDPSVTAFLISLKAGGYGLNLTGADTVIHFDPWWNPAVEAQATDRAHRIGQHKTVTAYKFIAAGTVEEKILDLQNQKRGLMDSVLDDQQPMMSGLTDQDIEEILKDS